MFIVKYYLAGALSALFIAFIIPNWYIALLLGWIGLSLSCVSAAYLFSTPQLFRKKQNGSIPIYIRWLFIPYLLGIHFYNMWARRTDKVPPIQKVKHNLFLACRLFPSDIDELTQLGVKAILDVTAEFDGLDWTAQSEDLAYLNVPVLDHQSPSQTELLKAVNWIENQRRAGKGVVVHCALGRGRSVLVVVAYLLSKNINLSVTQALKNVQGVRRTAGLNKFQLKALNKIHQKKHLDLRDQAWIIANPVSGGGKWTENKEEIEQRLSPFLQLKMVETTKETSARQLARQAINSGATTLIACGGDGTLTDVAQELVNTDLTLGIIPMGTANALAHVLLGSNSKIMPIEVACDNIIEHTVRRIDTANCNGQLLLLVVGIGFEQQMVELANREEKNQFGQLAYLQGLWQAMNLNHSMTFDIQIDDQDKQQIEACSLVIANAAPFTTVLAQGGGEPDIEDGLLDVTWLPPSAGIGENMFSLSELALSGLSTEYRSEHVKHMHARKIHIESDRTIHYVVDGETYSAEKLVIKVNPTSLNVLAPLKAESQ
ncbi:diacylglycerol kinase family protein [Neptunicella sp. SCSIO 80796]|uniref:diacylglycerol kinase family protein n=1 Tax=Neptunicella plasticusilytica TaxID=3117012 RepID=UPI003A4E4CF0